MKQEDEGQGQNDDQNDDVGDTAFAEYGRR